MLQKGKFWLNKTLYNIGLGMNIRSVSNSAFTKFPMEELQHRLFRLIPNINVSREELFCNIGRVLSRPDVGRGIMGATAIVTQPLIDYYNPKVDRDTAKVSTFRTIGKIIAGTTVGCAVRSACYYGVKALTNLDPNAKPCRKSLLPMDKVVQYLTNKNPDWIKNYNSTLAMIIGLGAMLFTNVMLDVPFTNFISKKLLNKYTNPNKEINPNPNIDIATQNTVNSDNCTNKQKDVKDKFHEIFVDKFADRNKWRAGL